jgi:hypothetical protein
LIKTQNPVAEDHSAMDILQFGKLRRKGRARYPMRSPGNDRHLGIGIGNDAVPAELHDLELDAVVDDFV